MPSKNHSCIVRGSEPGTADLSQSKLRISFSISGRCSNSGFALKRVSPLQLETVHFSIEAQNQSQVILHREMSFVLRQNKSRRGTQGLNGAEVS